MSSSLGDCGRVGKGVLCDDCTALAISSGLGCLAFVFGELIERSPDIDKGFFSIVGLVFLRSITLTPVPLLLTGALTEKC